MTLARVLSWLRQTTTVQGLAVLAMTIVLQLTEAVPIGAVIATAATSLVLLILPGQGDLAGKIGKLSGDVADVATSRGSKASVGILAKDSLVLAGDLPAHTPVITVTAASPG